VLRRVYHVRVRIVVSICCVLPLYHFVTTFKKQITLVRTQDTRLVMLVFKREKVSLSVESAVRYRFILLLTLTTFPEITPVACSIWNLVERVVHLLNDIRLVLCAESLFDV